MSEEDKRLFERLVNLSPTSETTNEDSNDPKTEVTEGSTKDQDTAKVPYFINVEDNDSREPLSWAIEYGDRDGVNLLLQYKADVDDVDELGRTGLYYLADGQGDPADNIAILRDPHKAGADMRISTVNQVTVFAQAVHRQSSSVLREVIKILPRIDQNSEPGHEDSAQESGQIIYYRSMIKAGTFCIVLRIEKTETEWTYQIS
ncbi:uncharacterized protein DFL_001262 [Arthrobotrys flagrans]|uniref:Uncharacterized protein n=1 Tax=Arthrobotrys flagrans TaxID=97331 RepID=A0A437AGN3_ARTFL|nr:hypothetical protein DFL_001262 [Arthrobotrys flagrans]